MQESDQGLRDFTLPLGVGREASKGFSSKPSWSRSTKAVSSQSSCLTSLCNPLKMKPTLWVTLSQPRTALGKMRRSSARGSMLADTEEMRAKFRHMGIAGQCVALRHLTRRFAKDLTHSVWQMQVDYILGKKVWKLRASNNMSLRCANMPWNWSSTTKALRLLALCQPLCTSSRHQRLGPIRTLKGKASRGTAPQRIRTVSHPPATHVARMQRLTAKEQVTRAKEARARATKQRLVRKKLRVNSTKPDVPTARSFTARQVVSSFASHTSAQEGATKTSAPWHMCARTAWAVTALKLAQHTADSDAKDLEIFRSARSPPVVKADIASRLLVLLRGGPSGLSWERATHSAWRRLT